MTTSIEWTEATWNPSTGCDRISPGCDNCYALKMAGRLKAMGQAKYQNDGDSRTSGPGFKLTVHPDTLTDPVRRRKPTTYFVNSMSDLFHADVPTEFIAKVLSIVDLTPRHTYQVLTKRSARMRNELTDLEFQRKMYGSLNPGEWPLPNLWLGTSIENDRYTFRADHLRATPAAVRFLSLEPLLGPLPSLDLTGIDWVIVGGESGPGARPMHPRWVLDIRNRCVEAGVAFFFKQWGAWSPGPDGPWTHRVELDGTFAERPTEEDQMAEIERCRPGWPRDSGWYGMSLVGKKAAGRLLDGRTWDQMPDRKAVPS